MSNDNGWRWTAIAYILSVKVASLPFRLFKTPAPPPVPFVKS